MTNNKKALRLGDMTLLTVSAILLLDTVAASASIGVSSLFWWAFLGVTFFIPYGLMNAEMGTTYPEDGGIYAWVRDAFGGRWASRITWSYWVNNLLWVPSVFILFASIFNQLFGLALGLGAQMAMGIALLWGAVAVNVLSLNIGKWIPNIGASIKILVFLVLIAGALSYVAANGTVNEISFAALVPSWGDGLVYLSTIIYGMLGFELMCATPGAIHNPTRNIPRAVLLSGAIIITMYAFGTFAVLAAIPVEDINLVEGLVDTLYLFFGGSEPGKVFAFTIGVGVLFTFFSNAVTWAIGCNKSASEAAAEGELPNFLAIEHKTHGTPLGAALAMGVFGSLVILLYGALAGSNEELFWNLFACSAVMFLLPYAGMVLSFARMRLVDPHRERPYRMPVSNGVAVVLAAYCAVCIGISAVFLIYTPGKGFNWPVTIGVILVMSLGEITIRSSEQRLVHEIEDGKRR
ncbi:MAG: APC family permease [Gammaproteobacteria bacterium]|nr:APC family permease [Gammaproteobacteria bacterium]